MNEPLIKSYVYHNNECFFVSTINRESSAQLVYGHVFAETMAWNLEPDCFTRKDLIGQFEDRKNSIVVHTEVCEQLIKTGELLELELSK